jgi:glycosyltransferase involved in cell wall biosynthesis
MRLLFATTIPYLPENTGGMLVSTHALLARLKACGAQVAAFAIPRASAQSPSADAPYQRDEMLGYPVYRAKQQAKAFRDVLGDFKPDVVMLPLGGPAALLGGFSLEAGCKLVLYAHNVEPRDLAGAPIERPGMRLIANSRFTARRLQTVLGTTDLPVVLPLIEPEAYRVDRPGDSVLLINPTPLKGVEIFFQLAAARPDTPFLAIESWIVAPAWQTVLANRARALGNVALWTPIDDMRVALSRARLVLMPSVLEETFGRVVAEAQLSGIPALVSDRGALPETLGGGGLAVPVDAEISAWIAALDRVWADTGGYGAAAQAEAARPERAPEHILQQFVAILDAL